MVTDKKVVIDDEAKPQLRQAYLYIRKQSLQNAITFGKILPPPLKRLIETLNGIRPTNTKPITMAASGHLNLTNTGLLFHIDEEQVTVLGVRHTKMNSLAY